MAVDAAGNVYIADTGNAEIRRVTPNGLIAEAAGNGHSGFNGDGGRAICSQLKNPSSVVVDAQGTFYIADAGNSRIRRVTPGGVMSTIAGNGMAGFGGDGGVSTSALVKNPSGLALGVGGLYVADTGNGRIRRIADGLITTTAGNGTSGFGGDGGPAGSAQLKDPTGVAVDSSGNLYIADSGNHRVRKVAPNGTISTIAGNGTAGFGGDNGPALSAQLKGPSAVAVDAAGNIYIADSGNNCVRVVTPAGVIRTIAGGQ